MGNKNSVALKGARILLGGWFIYLGMMKAMDPVAFLKTLNEYEIIQNYLALNFIAAVLPWFEILCGILLIAGIGVRGISLNLLILLTAFTSLVFLRALSLQSELRVGFCDIHFDCGCGTGRVWICGKLLENSALIGFATVLVCFGKSKK